MKRSKIQSDLVLRTGGHNHVKHDSDSPLRPSPIFPYVVRIIVITLGVVVKRPKSI